MTPSRKKSSYHRSTTKEDLAITVKKPKDPPKPNGPLTKTSRTAERLRELERRLKKWKKAHITKKHLPADPSSSSKKAIEALVFPTDQDLLQMYIGNLVAAFAHKLAMALFKTRGSAQTPDKLLTDRNLPLAYRRLLVERFDEYCDKEENAAYENECSMARLLCTERWQDSPERHFYAKMFEYVYGKTYEESALTVKPRRLIDPKDRETTPGELEKFKQ
ncbi:MAG: hypothetical protein Q9219_002024 [cf. Caloplaca sp. 3 TL-2023]